MFTRNICDLARTGGYHGLKDTGLVLTQIKLTIERIAAFAGAVGIAHRLIADIGRFLKLIPVNIAVRNL